MTIITEMIVDEVSTPFDELTPARLKTSLRQLCQAYDNIQKKKNELLEAEETFKEKATEAIYKANRNGLGDKDLILSTDREETILINLPKYYTTNINEITADKAHHKVQIKRVVNLD